MGEVGELGVLGGEERGLSGELGVGLVVEDAEAGVRDALGGQGRLEGGDAGFEVGAGEVGEGGVGRGGGDLGWLAGGHVGWMSGEMG